MSLKNKENVFSNTRYGLYQNKKHRQFNLLGSKDKLLGGRLLFLPLSVQYAKYFFVRILLGTRFAVW